MADIPWVLFIAASLVVLLDQLSKWYIAKILRKGDFFIWPFVQIKLIFNTQGILSGRRIPAIVAWAFIAGWVLLLMSNGLFFHNSKAQIGLGSALGGAMSNLSDQLKKGGIIDFICIRPWAAFNLADAAIVLGLCAAFWFW